MTRLMRISEAASSVGLTARALRTEIAKGRLQPVRIAGKIFLTSEALQSMIDQCRDQPRDRASLRALRAFGRSTPSHAASLIAGPFHALKLPGFAYACSSRPPTCNRSSEHRQCAQTFHHANTDLPVDQ